MRSVSLAPTVLPKENERNNVFFSSRKILEFENRLKIAQQKIESSIWKEQNDALLEFRVLVHDYTECFESRYDLETFHNLIQRILTCSNSLRSSFAKEAILTLDAFLTNIFPYYSVQPKTIKILAESLIPKLVISNKQFVAKAASDCLTKAASIQDAEFLTYLLFGFGKFLNHCNSQLSARVCQLIFLAVQTLVNMRALTCSYFSKTILPLMTRMLIEKLPAGKALGRKVLELALENVICESENESVPNIVNKHFRTTTDLSLLERTALEKLLMEYVSSSRTSNKLFFEHQTPCTSRSKTLPPTVRSKFITNNKSDTKEQETNSLIGLSTPKSYESNNPNLSQLARFINRKPLSANALSNSKFIKRKEVHENQNQSFSFYNKTRTKINSEKNFVTQNKTVSLKKKNNELPQLFVPQYTSQFNLSQKIQSMLHQRRLAYDHENPQKEYSIPKENLNPLVFSTSKSNKFTKQNNFLQNAPNH